MTSSDPSGANVVAVVRNYATGVIGDSTVLQIQPSWLQSTGAPGGTNAREQQVLVTVTYQFHSVIPVVPIPPVTITGESLLVINN